MKIHVQIAQDYISAFITIFAEEGDTDFTYDVSDLEKSLAEVGVIVGINKEVLTDIIKKKTVNQKTLVAEYVEPKAGDDARVEIKKKPKKKDEIKPPQKDDGEIDYIAPRDGFITYVPKGETLAVKYPPTRGEPGKNVLGRAIPGKFGKEISLDLFNGINTKIEGDKLIAECDGIVSLHTIQVNVENKFTISDHVGRSTGSIDLPKDLDVTLIVNGDIQRGFNVTCNRLNVTGAIEAATIDCNVLKVKNGIVGIGDEIISADEITTGYINGERKVFAKILSVIREISSGAHVSAEVVKAYTIQGSTVYAKEAIWCDYLNGKNTVYVGINYKAKMDYDELSRKIAEINEPLDELRTSSYASAKKMKQLKELSKLNPKHPLIQKELPKIQAIKQKLEKFEILNKNLVEQRDKCESDIYSEGDPFLLVRSGFAKDTSTGASVEPDTIIHLKEHSAKVYETGRGGLYTMSKYGISFTMRYNIKELKDKYEKLTYIAQEVAAQTRGESGDS